MRRGLLTLLPLLVLALLLAGCQTSGCLLEYANENGPRGPEHTRVGCFGADRASGRPVMGPCGP